MAQFLWGPATLIILMGVGLYLNVNLRFYPIRRLFPTLRSLIRKNDAQIGKNTNESVSKGVSPVGALMTSLASCIGTVNVVQANSISAAVKYSFDIDARISGAIMSAAVAVTIIGGIFSYSAEAGCYKGCFFQ